MGNGLLQERLTCASLSFSSLSSENTKRVLLLSVIVYVDYVAPVVSVVGYCTRAYLVTSRDTSLLVDLINSTFIFTLHTIRLISKSSSSFLSLLQVRT